MTWDSPHRQLAERSVRARSHSVRGSAAAWRARGSTVFEKNRRALWLKCAGSGRFRRVFSAFGTGPGLNLSTAGVRACRRPLTGHRGDGGGRAKEEIRLEPRSLGGTGSGAAVAGVYKLRRIPPMTPRPAWGAKSLRNEVCSRTVRLVRFRPRTKNS
ncbi:MAG: hypothetical protein RL077_1809 [Verrucomicrobiota bacterium]